MTSPRTSLAFLVLLVGAVVLWAAERGTDEEVRNLVGRLGADGRPAAARAESRLAEIGLPALAAVREAALSDKGKPRARAAERVLHRLVQDAQKSLEKQLAKFKPRQAVIRPLAAGPVARIFPASLFFSVRFPQYPAAVRPPAPLKVHNLFVLDRDGQPDQLTDFPALEDFFRKNVGKGLREDRARDAARAWLLLWQELFQDGYYQFTIPADGVKAGEDTVGLKVVGRAVVKPERGNQGFLQVTLTFDLTGELDQVKVSRQLVRGTRPK